MAKKATPPCSQSSSTVYPVQLSSIISVVQLRQLMNSKPFTLVSSCPGVYRWWFPKDELSNTFGNFGELLCKFAYTKIIHGKEYIALYFGKGEKLKKRIQQHVKGTNRYSTLRRSIKAILNHYNNGTISVDQCLDKCYWEWDYYPDPEEVEHAELCQKTIAYPLNIQDNHTVSQEWIANLKRLRR